VRDRGVAEQADAHVLHAEIRHRAGRGDLAQEGGTIDQRAVGVAVEEIRGQVALEPGHIRQPYRADEALVELVQDLEVALHVRNG
jgi:hypothetical protein